MADMTASEPAELLPCPFCGGDATLDNLDGPDDYFVACTNCKIEQFAIYTAHIAVQRWNRRAPAITSATAAPELLEALKVGLAAFELFMKHANWGASALTADAVRGANEAPAKMRAAIAKAKVAP